MGKARRHLCPTCRHISVDTVPDGSGWQVRRCAACGNDTDWCRWDGPPRVWPVQPLLDFTRATGELLAVRCRVDRTMPSRWAAAGGLSDVQADRAAISLGVHPSAVWHDWFHPPIYHRRISAEDCVQGEAEAA